MPGLRTRSAWLQNPSSFLCLMFQTCICVTFQFAKCFFIHVYQFVFITSRTRYRYFLSPLPYSWKATEPRFKPRLPDTKSSSPSTILQLPDHGSLLPKALEGVLFQHFAFDGNSSDLESEERTCFMWEYSDFGKFQALSSVEGWLAVVPTWASDHRAVA